jgi:DNA-binding FrmR family transcriptional regulator
MMDADSKKAVTRRLRRIAGQLEAISRMVDEDRYCVDILLQIAATQGALGQAGRVVLKSHVETCVAEALASGSAKQRREKIDELLEVFSRYGYLRNR